MLPGNTETCPLAGLIVARIFGGLARCCKAKRVVERLTARATVLARVADWQTRWLQVPVPARAWGFKSPLAHTNEMAPDLGFYLSGRGPFVLEVLEKVLSADPEGS